MSTMRLTRSSRRRPATLRMATCTTSGARRRSRCSTSPTRRRCGGAGHRQTDPFPDGPKEHRHRRLLCRLLCDRARPRLAPQGGPRGGNRRAVEYYREHGSRLLGRRRDCPVPRSRPRRSGSRSELDDAIGRVLASGRYILGGDRGVRARVRRVLWRRVRARRRHRGPTRSRSPCSPSGSSPVTR